jgi:hypothetical protein
LGNGVLLEKSEAIMEQIQRFVKMEARDTNMIIWETQHLLQVFKHGIPDDVSQAPIVP